jgi:hypothetical protein
MHLSAAAPLKAENERKAESRRRRNHLNLQMAIYNTTYTYN